MKIAFFGTSDRSVPILESLKNNFDLVLCVTKEDVLVGRHQTPKEVEVKSWSKAHRVNFVSINESLKKDADKVIEQIKSSKAEIGVVADFGFIIPQEILDLFPKGLVNIHFSLLPKYRGASPVQAAILNSDAETGITYQIMEKTLDTGPIVDQITYSLRGTETSGGLYQQMFTIAAEHLPKVLEDYLAGKTTPKTQDESQASYTYSPSHPSATHVFKEDARLDWKSPSQKIDAAVRAYYPWPIAWTTLGEMLEAKEKLSNFTEIKDPKNLSKIVKIHSAKVLGNKIVVKELQMEGGKVLSWEQFKNGYLL
jgi:methionyl-tRNA formyltransferase